MQAVAKSAWLTTALIVVAVIAWRLSPASPNPGASAGWMATAAAWACAAALGARDPVGARRIMPVIALLATITAALRLSGDAVWPCEWRCHGARRYALLLTVPIEAFATAACALWTVALARAWRLAPLMTWMLGGASLLYLGIALASGFSCGHCMATHTVILAGVLLSLRDAWPWRMRVLAMVTAAAVLAAILWSTAGIQVEPVAPPPLDPSGLVPPPVGPDDRP